MSYVPMSHVKEMAHTGVAPASVGNEVVQFVAPVESVVQEAPESAAIVSATIESASIQAKPILISILRGGAA